MKKELLIAISAFTFGVTGTIYLEEKLSQISSINSNAELHEEYVRSEKELIAAIGTNEFYRMQNMGWVKYLSSNKKGLSPSIRHMIGRYHGLQEAVEIMDKNR